MKEIFSSRRNTASYQKAKRILCIGLYGEREAITLLVEVAAYLEAETRHQATKNYLSRLLDFLKDMRVIDINQAKVDSSPATKKRAVNTPISALLRFAVQRGWCDVPVFASIKIKEKSVTFLYPGEIRMLIEMAAPHLEPLLVFLVGTGARASEAIELEWEQRDLRGRMVVLWQK
ncbi:hypothetical protein PT277_04680 [Acetobacteraceae bacterium ESL0709]|nr:hypothetical protein [Acetobacteraceae bacterium ESL0697]MDF7677991.1 hypothetical protein [Acetobacteraceae bacterium ESL0709]